MRRETTYPELDIAEKLTVAAVVMAALVVSILLCMHDHASYEYYTSTPAAQMSGQEMLDAYNATNPVDENTPEFF